MLTVQSLQMSFRSPDAAPLPILNVPAFSLAAAEQALIGTSGSGKTTLLHLLAVNILVPDSERSGIPIAGMKRISRNSKEAEAAINSAGGTLDTFFKRIICCRDLQRWKMFCWVTAAPA